jgi:hypothetical protein
MIRTRVARSLLLKRKQLGISAKNFVDMLNQTYSPEISVSAPSYCKYEQNKVTPPAHIYVACLELFEKLENEGGKTE